MSRITVDRKLMRGLESKINSLEPHTNYDKQQIDDLKKYVEKMYTTLLDMSEHTGRTIEIPMDSFLELNRVANEHNHIKENMEEAMIDLYSFIDDDQRSPVLSENYLYEKLGKETARSTLARLRRVVEAAGLDCYDINQRVNDKLNNNTLYDYHIVFETAEDATTFYLELRRYVNNNASEGDTIPRSVVPLKNVKVDPPEERILLSGKKYMVDTVHKRIPHQRKIYNVSRKYKSTIDMLINNNHGTILETNIVYDMD